MKLSGGCTSGINEGDATRARERSVSKMTCSRIAARLLLCLWLCAIVIPSVSAQQPTSNGSSSPTPVPLSRLYWHFLNYQSFLDNQAAALEAQGQDGSAVGNQMQELMGLSDSDYALIRASLQRVTAEAQALNAQAIALHVTGISSANISQLYALTAQRDADINAEISSLTLSLSPGSMATFESFLTQYFARYPAQGLINPATGQPISAVVQP
jgi:hypothetical protein